MPAANAIEDREQLTRTYWEFGDIVRVANHEADDRRWMIVTTTGPGRPWVLIFVGPSPFGLPVISTWDSMHGFERVVET